MQYDWVARSDSAKLYNDEPSCTKQDFKDKCDLNNILKKYSKNGVNPFVVTKDARYGDFTDVPSYQDALDLVNSAHDLFDQLPAKLRERFANDPGRLLNFLNDSQNHQEAISLGLIEAPQVDTKVKSGASGEASGGGAAEGGGS